MKVLWLGPERPALTAALAAAGDEAFFWQDRLDPLPPCAADAEFVVSYGYRHMIRAPALDRWRNRLINLHISLLPWNRGADPNLWSALDRSPTGVTIHLVDAGLDTGPMLLQRQVTLAEDDTLRTSHARLSEAIERLFVESWTQLREGRIAPRPQPPGGSFHFLRDRAAAEHLLTSGWDTPLRDLLGRAAHLRRPETAPLPSENTR